MEVPVNVNVRRNVNSATYASLLIQHQAGTQNNIVMVIGITKMRGHLLSVMELQHLISLLMVHMIYQVSIQIHHQNRRKI